MKISFAVYTAALVSTFGYSAQALGINCDGSNYCSNFSSGVASRLSGYIQGISDNAWYNNGQQIACIGKSSGSGGICAFLQNTGGANGKTIKQLAPYIPNHGCGVCGSVPYYYPQGNNNVADGELTFNYVSNACHSWEGLC
ncbi:hypothetical protein CVT24_001103 [Panaeolus cyanescens]|uniref:Killer toxin Kp4 domain-containing protein n=1 Tax=Panaeolus cyanescens TaxID=181874 RepID=A0A409X9H8_9AGAR|nr:hypothetical protein CVT24_001103 [Panaeolus cyanescens]